MTIYFLDGFDNYGSKSYVSSSWDAVNLDNFFTSIDAGRNPSPTSSVPSNSLSIYGDDYIRKNLYGSYSQFLIGFAFKFTSYPSTNNSTILKLFHEGSTISSLALSPSGRLIINDKDGNQIFDTVSGLLATNNWYFIEFKVKTETTQSLGLRVNGVGRIQGVGNPSEAIGSGLDFASGLITETDITHFVLYGQMEGFSQIGNAFYDDLYVDVASSLSSSNLIPGSLGTFINDAQVMTFLPVQDDYVSGFITETSSSSNLFESINDTTPDDDTTHISSTISGSLATFNYDFNIMSSSVNIIAYAGSMYAKKLGAEASASIKFVVSSSSGRTDLDTIEERLTSNYHYYNSTVDNSQAITPITRNDLINHKFGVKDGTE